MLDLSWLNFSDFPLAGMVIDCGHTATSVTLVFESLPMRHATQKVPCGGSHAWECLMKSLSKARFNNGQSRSIAEWGEKHCFYSLNYSADTKICQNLAGRSVSMLDQYVSCPLTISKNPLPFSTFIRRYEGTQLGVLPNELLVHIERIIQQHDMLVELKLEPNVHSELH